jgi:hypothetical protein
LVLLVRLTRTNTSASTTNANSDADSDMCIGLTDAMRLDADATTGVGLYLNLLPVRLRHASTPGRG